ncbi:DUF669 domain-containing protein [Candidatus Dojkabacteria bacterium]|jgi:hypothetical protein|nr:DUF669 domain-containing protein [Candidatus Dojkabacteria bacterium]
MTSQNKSSTKKPFNGPSKEFSPLPEGDYLVRLIQVDEKKTAKGDSMLSARFQVAKGDFKDRLIFENYMLTHENNAVTDISKRKLQDLASATGDKNVYETVGDAAANLNDFLEIPFMATVGLKKPYTNKDGITKIDNAITRVSPR